MTRALVSTLPPAPGGVAAMLGATLRVLTESGIEVTVAWYEPYSWTPRLSVPAWRLGTRRPGAEPRDVAGATGRAVGAWLPELEFTHYRPTRHWRDLVGDHDLHLAVSGSCLAARPYADLGVPFLAWVATDWEGDRVDRVRRFPPHRRLLDAAVVRPVARRLERRILRAGRIVALSEATRRALERVAGEGTVADVLPQPIDVDELRPDPSAVETGRVGVVGRLDDPRKNLALFLAAMADPAAVDAGLRGVVLGARPGQRDLAGIERLGLAGRVELLGHVDRERYVRELQRLDLLVLPSHQEGLGIAALEAMACGAPVVSTRCGGPEEFVVDGESGYLTGFGAGEIARRLAEVSGDRSLRHRLAEGARRIVETRYAWSLFRDRLNRQLDGVEWASGGTRRL